MSVISDDAESVSPSVIETPKPTTSYRFQWDPSRKGPSSVAGTTDYGGAGHGGGDYFSGQPRLSLLPNASSLSLAPTAIPSEWSSAKHGFHAISTVLNNPHKKQAPPKAHSHLPAVVPADLPRVRRKDFDGYLKGVNGEWERFVKSQSLGRVGTADLGSHFYEQEEDEDEEGEDVPQKNNKLNAANIPALSTVPSVFFDSSFDLSNPKIFSLVVGTSDPTSDPTSLSHSLPLLDTLSHYSDTIEQHLTHEITLRSPSFFSALSNLHSLSSSSSSALTQLTSLRTSLLQLDRDSALRGLELVGREQKWEGIDEVKEAVKVVERAREGIKLGKGLVAAGQWNEAVGVVDGLWEMWEGTPDVEEEDVPTRPVPSRQGSGLGGITEEEEDEDEDIGLEHGKEQKSTSAVTLPLKSLAAYQSLPTQLRQLTLEIAASLSSEVVAVLRADLIERLSKHKPKTNKNPELNDAEVPDPERDARLLSLHDRVRPLLIGLVRTKGIREGMITWREVVLGEVRNIVSNKVGGGAWMDGEKEEDQGEVNGGAKPNGVPRGKKPGSLDLKSAVPSRVGTPSTGEMARTTSTPSSTSTAATPTPSRITTIPHAEFMLLLADICSSLLCLVEGVKEQSGVVEGIVKEALETSTSSRISPSTGATSPDQRDDLQETPIQALDSLVTSLSDLLSSTIELANLLPARLISLRASAPLLPSSLLNLTPEEKKAKEKNSNLNPITDVGMGEFVGFYRKSWEFVVNSEVIGRRMVVGLRGVIVSQAKAFLQAFHQARLTRSAKLVEDEQWTPSEVSRSLQNVVDVIVGSAVQDAKELIISEEDGEQGEQQHQGSEGTQPTPTQENGSAPPPAAGAGFPISSTPSSKHLHIESQQYFLVSCTAEVLILLLDYLRLVVNLKVVNLKTLGTDVMNRTVEFLKAFNSRVCQVVLGAGAMRSAGLRNITAKHLALASQSLSVMFELIPYVRETFRRHLSPKEAVMLVEFDKLKRDYQEHQNEIHSKLIAIMGDRLMTHIKSLQAVDWTTPKPDRAVNDYIEILVKETVTLHKVLSRYLSMQVVEYVMTQVFAAINHGLSEEYNKIELPSQEAKMRLLADAKYLHAKLSTLKNVGTISSMLITVVSEKPIPRPPGALPSPNPASPSPPTPQRSSTLMSSTNERLKGLLSGRSPTFDKALPSPMRRSSYSPAPEQQDHISPRTSLNGNAPTPPPKPATPSATGGGYFMQVGDASMSGLNTPSSLPRTGSPEPSEASTDIAVSRESVSPLPPHPVAASSEDEPQH